MNKSVVVLKYLRDVNILVKIHSQARLKCEKEKANKDICV